MQYYRALVEAIGAGFEKLAKADALVADTEGGKARVGALCEFHRGAKPLIDKSLSAEAHGALVELAQKMDLAPEQISVFKPDLESAGPTDVSLRRPR
jgi:hypothetical protein